MMTCTNDDVFNAKSYNITLVQGTTFELNFNVVGVDLTDATASMAVRGGYPDYEIYFYKTTSDGITITVDTPITDQNISITVDAEDMPENMVDGDYDIVVTLEDSRVIKLLYGKTFIESIIPRP